MPTLEEMSKEELIAALRALQGNPPVASAPLENASLIHDLEVHQIELEMQNRQLRETEAQLQGSMQRYMELYDFAPIAYLTLDVEGRIEEANLTAATFLGTERGQLLGKPMISFVAVEPSGAAARAPSALLQSARYAQRGARPVTRSESQASRSVRPVSPCSMTPVGSSAAERP